MLNKFRYLYWRYVLKDCAGYHRTQGTAIGKNCRIYTWHFSSEPFLIAVGANTVIASGVRLLTHDGATTLARDEKGRRHKYTPISIGANVFIGIDAIILPGVNVGDNCIVAAGSVVHKSVPDGYVVAGNPAKILCPIEAYKERAFATLPSDQDLDWSLPYEQRVLAVLQQRPRPPFKV